MGCHHLGEVHFIIGDERVACTGGNLTPEKEDVQEGSFQGGRPPLVRWGHPAVGVESW